MVDDLLDDITLARAIRQMTRGMTGKRRAVIMLDCRRTQQIEDVETRPGCATYEPKLLARRRGRVEIPAQVPCGLKQGLARPLGVSANQRRSAPALGLQDSADRRCRGVRPAPASQYHMKRENRRFARRF